MSDRFYWDGPLGPGKVVLDGPEVHHLSAVRRFQIGDEVVLFNGDGHEYAAKITEIAKKTAALDVTTVLSPARELAFSLHVAAALPKGDRGDFLIEKLTELGATDFTPLLTERSVVKADNTKVEKLRRAVIEASKQCGRNVLMKIHPPSRWADWCLVQTGPRLIAHPSDSVSNPSSSGPVTIAIGPEGGFSDAEVAIALSAGWECLSLGPRILRVETAALAAAVLLGKALG